AGGRPSTPPGRLAARRRATRRRPTNPAPPVTSAGPSARGGGEGGGRGRQDRNRKLKATVAWESDIGRTNPSGRHEKRATIPPSHSPFCLPGRTKPASRPPRALSWPENRIDRPPPRPRDLPCLRLAARRPWRKHSPQ
ncbi:MAG: hypothetical protein LBK99_06860, partial [Opitutaceae bacterium]|nr:hypothetical protein [Opitutaceae bacterium]